MAGEAVEPFNADIDKHAHYDTIRLMDGNGGLLDQLIGEGKISTDQYHSGLRLFRDYWMSEIDAVRALDWTRPVVDCQPMGDIGDSKLDAINAVTKISAKVGFLAMHPFVKMIVQGQNPKDYAKERWPLVGPRDARPMALGAICSTLSMIDEFYYGRRKTKVQSGGVEGFRPGGLVR